MFALTSLFLAAVTPPATQPAPAPAKVKVASTDKKVCRSLDAEVGTRLGTRRICKLQSEWRAEEVESARGLRRLEERNMEAPALNGRSSGDSINLDPRGPR